MEHLRDLQTPAELWHRAGMHQVVDVLWKGQQGGDCTRLTCFKGRFYKSCRVHLVDDL